MQRTMRWGGGAVSAGLLAAGLLGVVLAPAMAPAPAGASAPVYYLALGDSLAYGIGASSPSDGYVGDLYRHEATRIEGLQLENLGCPGATTTSMLDGPGCSAGTQLADAEAFLAAHPGQVAFATIDIGANDVDGCLDGTTIDESCVENGLAAIGANLPQILSGLSAADPGLPLFAMNYYDPFLAVWLTGTSGQATAEESVDLLGDLNGTLDSAYTAAGATVADVATAFQSTDFATTGSWAGITLPQNVADICNWTNMCTAEDIHANTTGHALIAGVFEPLVDAALPATTCDPPTITSPATATATEGQAFSFTVDTCSTAVPSLRATHLPSGLAMVANGDGTATIHGTPSSRDAGVYDVTLTATVSGQTPAAQTLALTVDHPAVFHTRTLTLAHTGVAVDEPVVTTGGYPVPALTTSSALPPGLTLVDGGNGTATLEGTPGADGGGVWPVTVTATNGVGSPVTASYTLTVYQAPAFTSADGDTVTAHVPMTPFTVTTTGYPAPTLRAAGLPSGLHLVAAGGTGTISGTPGTMVGPGTYHVTLVASGRAGTVDQAFTLTVG